MAGPPRWLTALNLLLIRAGLEVGSQHILSIAGRKTGVMRSVPFGLHADADADDFERAGERLPVFRIDAI